MFCEPAKKAIASSSFFKNACFVCCKAMITLLTSSGAVRSFWTMTVRPPTGISINAPISKRVLKTFALRLDQERWTQRKRVHMPRLQRLKRLFCRYRNDDKVLRIHTGFFQCHDQGHMVGTAQADDTDLL